MLSGGKCNKMQQNETKNPRGFESRIFASHCIMTPCGHAYPEIGYLERASCFTPILDVAKGVSTCNIASGHRAWKRPGDEPGQGRQEGGVMPTPRVKFTIRGLMIAVALAAALAAALLGWWKFVMWWLLYGF